MTKPTAYDRYDFSQKGFNDWLNTLPSEARGFLRTDQPSERPSEKFINIMKDTTYKTQALFLPHYDALVRYGRPVRIRLLAIVLSTKEGIQEFTAIANQIEKHAKAQPDYYRKVKLYLNDLNQASKEILGPKMAGRLYRNQTLSLIVDTLGTVASTEPEHNAGPDIE